MKQRDPALDLVRSVAILFVICVHFFLYSGYYNTPLVGLKLVVALPFRWLFFTCVPLFIMLTGYLQNGKKLCGKYYLSIIRILFVYFAASLLCILYKFFVLKTPMSFADALLSVTSYTGAPYSWYVNMYIGLFLLIPFLNVLYHGLESRKSKRVLILTLAALTSLSTTVLYIFPSFWEILYPLTYYFIGAYICEYRVKLRKSVGLIAVLLILLVETAMTLMSSRNGNFSAVIDTYGSLPTMLLSVVLFLVLYDVNIRSKIFSKIVFHIGDASFGMYLLSWLFDQTFYPILCTKVADIGNRLYFAPVVVIAVFVCSFALSKLINLLYLPIKKLLKA